MKKSITKILAVLLVAVLTLSLASCWQKRTTMTASYQTQTRTLQL